MDLIIGIIIIAIIYGIIKANENAKFNAYDMNKVSTGKMAQDFGKSPSEIRRNIVAGKYDKDEHWKL